MGIKEIIPLLAAIIGLTPVILNWLKDRSKEAASRRAVQKAKEQIEFWQTWLKAQQEVTTAERFSVLKLEVSQRLDDIIKTNIEEEIKDKTKVETSDHSFIQKILLLYIPRTASGWIFHTLFYITISFTAMFLFGSALPSENINADPTWATFTANLDSIIPVSIFFLLIAFILQKLARKSDRRYFKKMQSSEK